MAAVYILFSQKLNRYYIGSCLDLEIRLSEHRSGNDISSFTAKAQDWILFLSADDLKYSQARLIEGHIKRMHSKKYVENLKKYPEILKKLIERYSS